jgi:hypothetical protein
MAKHGLLLVRHRRDRPERIHDGKVVTIRSNHGWSSDGFEFTCWNGKIARVAFILDTHDREAIAWRRDQRLGWPNRRLPHNPEKQESRRLLGPYYISSIFQEYTLSKNFAATSGWVS